MTIANPKTPEAAQRLLAELLEEPGALEVPQDSTAKAAPSEDGVTDTTKKDEPKKAAPAVSVFDSPTLRPAEAPATVRAPNVVLTIPEGDLLDIQDDEPEEEKPARVVPPPLPAPARVVPPPLPAQVDIRVGLTAQLTGIEPPPVSKYIPPVLEGTSDAESSAPAREASPSLPPMEVVEEDLLPIGDDEPSDQKTDGASAKPDLPAEATAKAKEKEPDPVIEVREEPESQASSVDVPVSSHGGPADNQVARERPPDFSKMEKPEFGADDMRRKHPDGGYVVETELLWKFLRHLDLMLTTDHVFISKAMEDAAKQRWLRSKKMAVVELFARGEALRSLKGRQADQKRLIQLRDIEGIVGELDSLAEKETDEDRKRWFHESLRPAASWIENQLNMDRKLRENKELTTAGKTPHGATPAPQPVPEAPPASMPKPVPEPRQKGVTTPTRVHFTPAPPNMTPPPQAVHTPPVAKREATPAKATEKTEPPKKPLPEKPKEGWWEQLTGSSGSVVIAASIAAALFMAIGLWAMNERSELRSDDRIASAVKRPAMVKKVEAAPVVAQKSPAKPVVTPVATDDCQTVKLAGVYGKPLSDKERGDVPAWDCSKQGHFTLLTSDTGKVCGCTFKN